MRLNRMFIIAVLLASGCSEGTKPPDPAEAKRQLKALCAALVDAHNLSQPVKMAPPVKPENVFAEIDRKQADKGKWEFVDPDADKPTAESQMNAELAMECRSAGYIRDKQ